MTASERTIKLLNEQVGRSLAEVETPVAVVDLDRLERNLSGLQNYATEHGIALWPHTKTHKTARDRPAPGGARGRRPDGREDRRGRGVPRGRCAAAPDALPAVRAGEGRPAGAARGRRARADRRRRLGVGRRGALGRPAEARRHGRAAGRARRRPAPHRSGHGRRRAGRRAGPRDAAGRQR